MAPRQIKLDDPDWEELARHRRASDSDDIPDWAIGLMRYMGGIEFRLGSRLARIEGIGAAAIGLISLFIAALGVLVASGHVR
jgi:hypothetical protein